MVVTCSRALWRLQDKFADEMIGEFFGPARLVSGPGLAVVTRKLLSPMGLNPTILKQAQTFASGT